MSKRSRCNDLDHNYQELTHKPGIFCTKCGDIQEFAAAQPFPYVWYYPPVIYPQPRPYPYWYYTVTGTTTTPTYTITNLSESTLGNTATITGNSTTSW